MKSLLFVALVASIFALSTADVPLEEPELVKEEPVVETVIEELASARDYQEPAPVHPPADSSDGYYYYYYPVEEKKPTGIKKKEEFTKLETIIVTGIIIIIVLLALQLIPNLVPLLNLLGGLGGLAGLPIVIPNGKRSLDYAREAVSSTLEGMSLERMGELTVLVVGALEEEQCFRRLVCESGKMAKGREAWIDLAKVVMPGKYTEHMRIMKESALNKTDCKSYKCGPLPIKKEP